MSQSSATIIFEDSHGFIWTGTQNGLNKFDGSEFTIYEKSLDNVTGLTDGYVRTILEDNEDLYIGTIRGLSYYDRSLDKISPYKFKKGGEQLAFKDYNSIIKVDDYLWLGTYSQGLFRYNLKTGETKDFTITTVVKGDLNSNNILKVAHIEKDKFLVVSTNHVFVIDEELKIIKHHKEKESITSVFNVDKKSYLLGTLEGILIDLKVSPKFELKTFKTKISDGYGILSLAKSNNNDIWIGTENDGLFIYSKDKEKIKHLKSSPKNPNIISSNSIWSILCSSNNVMWIAPFKNGLNFYDAQYHKFEHIKANLYNAKALNNNIINSFSEDEKRNLWIGTDGGGLNYWDRKSNTFESYSLDNGRLSSNVIVDIVKISDDELWLGTWAKGLIRFNTKTKKYKVWDNKNSILSSNNIMDILKDKKGRIWVACLFGGLEVYYPETKTLKNFPLTSKIDGTEMTNVAKLMEDKDGNIWVGTETSGLFKLTEHANSWVTEHYYNKGKNKVISNNFINSMITDNEGTIWVGTQAGLSKYLSKPDSFESFSKFEGLKNDIKGIIYDEDKFLWLSTGDGLLKFNPSSNESSTYGVNDGLQSKEFNKNSFYTTSKGEYLYGGNNGFNIFLPEEVGKSVDKPMIFLSDLKIFNKPIYPDDEFRILKKDISQVDSLKLNYDHAVVSFSFKALTYRHPDQIKYAYFLEGFETEWNYVGNTNDATYTNLNPGNYTLRIKSTNSDGVWNTNEKQLAITVIPPFWLTWWFRTLLIIAILGTIYLFYFLRMRSIKKYQAQLERRIDERTKELQLQKKKLSETAKELSDKNDEIQRFTYAVSHDLKSPLNSIEVMANLISLDLDLDKYPDTKECLGYVTQSCTIMKTLIEDITEIARLGKIENKKEVLDAKEIIQTAGNMAIGRFREQKAELIIGDALPTIYGDRNRFIQVFENLIDNAIKYMGDQKNPLVEIKSIVSKDTHKFLVIDNGSGMDAKSLNKLFTPFQRFDSKTQGTGLGLYMIKKIIESHNGNISAESEGKGKGTTFVITLPKAA